MKLWKAVLILALLTTATACANRQKMGLTTKTSTIDVSTQSLLLMSAQVANGRVPACQPEAAALQIEDSSGEIILFNPDDQGTIANRQVKNYNRYSLRVALPPGQYIIRGINGICRMFPIVASYFMPLHAKIDVVANSVVYLGRVDAVVRERREGDFRAGPVIPLIDQASAGFTGGTWEVTVSDASEEDLAYMRGVFPVLQTVEVQKNILPPFDRQYAFKWWDEH